VGDDHGEGGEVEGKGGQKREGKLYAGRWRFQKKKIEGGEPAGKLARSVRSSPLLKSRALSSPKDENPR